MEARATTISEYKRSVDSLFGRVEQFNLKRTHRVQIKVGKSYFISATEHADADAARRAAKRLSLTAAQRPTTA